MTSDRLDHTNRPAMLARLSMPTKPAASAAVTVESPLPLRKKSWIIGAACSRMPMPAVTLQNSTIHRNANCGVRIAWEAVTRAPLRPGCGTTVSSSPWPGGTRTSAAPISMKTR